MPEDPVPDDAVPEDIGHDHDDRSRTVDFAHAGVAESVAGKLAEFARVLRENRKTVDETVAEIAARSVELIASADSGCVTTVRGGRRTVVASTDPIAEELCRRQYELGEGPIDNELQHLDNVVSGDLEHEDRWPQFAAAAVEAGMLSVAAFRLFTGEGDLGALVLYSRSADAFGVDDLIVGESLAAHAAVALLAARERAQFETALASRDIIGQAKGMLMERYDIDAIQAFELLAKLSQHENRPLNKIASSLVETDHPVTSVAEDRRKR